MVGRSVVGIKQEDERFLLVDLPGAGREALVRDYFQLDVDLGEIVRRISEADPAAGVRPTGWSGLRLLRQDPEEAILSFVCSTANSVPASPTHRRVQQALRRPPRRDRRADCTLPSLAPPSWLKSIPSN